MTTMKFQCLTQVNQIGVFRKNLLGSVRKVGIDSVIFLYRLFSKKYDFPGLEYCRREILLCCQMPLISLLEEVESMPGILLSRTDYSSFMPGKIIFNEDYMVRKKTIITGRKCR